MSDVARSDRLPYAASAVTARARPPLPVAAHVLFAFWILLLMLGGVLAPETYRASLQEDRFIEWWTVPLFAAAGIFALRAAWRDRRVFDALVGVFCIFVAGEEFSWGQRLLGFTPPAPFLEHNFQQEFTLHNFSGVFGQPKWSLVAVLAGYSGVLPLLHRFPAGRRILERVGATAPSATVIPWFAAAILLLVWYPLPFTGEWVEALAGGLFLITLAPTPRRAALVAAGGALLAIALTAWSARGFADAAEVACAHAEAAALLDDLVYGDAATLRLAGASSVHKRVFTAMREGYIDESAVTTFHAAPCPADPSAAERRRYAVDPWGTAYWVYVARGADSVALRVYSFGPNRRRDGGSATGGGDDAGASVVFTP